MTAYNDEDENLMGWRRSTDLDPKALEATITAIFGCNPGDYTRGLVAASITAYLAALPPSPAVVTNGWVMVPVVATAAMLDAHYEAHARADTAFAGAQEVWAAMLAAAPPSPPALDVAGRDGIDKAIALLRPAGNIAYNMAAGAQSQNKDGAAYEFGRIRDAIDAAIRALKETP